MMSLAFAVWNFYYAVIRYNCAAVCYDMHVGSLILEFALVSSLLLLQFVVPVVAHSYFLVMAHQFSAVTIRILQAYW